MRTIPDSGKFVIADHNGWDPAPGPCPNPRGWYHSVAGLRDTPEGLVATYRLSDSHTALFTHIMTARSADGGRTWEGHRSIAHRNVWQPRRAGWRPSSAACATAAWWCWWTRATARRAATGRC